MLQTRLSSNDSIAPFLAWRWTWRSAIYRFIPSWRLICVIGLLQFYTALLTSKIPLVSIPIDVLVWRRVRWSRVDWRVLVAVICAGVVIVVRLRRTTGVLRRCMTRGCTSCCPSCSTIWLESCATTTTSSDTSKPGLVALIELRSGPPTRTIRRAGRLPQRWPPIQSIDRNLPRDCCNHNRSRIRTHSH